MKTVVKRRDFGKNGIAVSEISFGAMNLRRLKTIDEAMIILNYVIDQGINLIDTARAYNGENESGEFVESEVLVGKALGAREDIDEPIVVITKGHGYTMPELDEELHLSRSKLGIEGKGDLNINGTPIKLVYLFHGLKADRWAVMKESGVLKRILELKEEGLITYAGFSSHYKDGVEIREAIESGVFDVVELPYNVYSRSMCDEGLLKLAYDKGIAIINMKALNGNGMVPIREMLGDNMAITTKDMIKFCLSNPYISTIDAGAINPQQFKDDIDASLEDELTENDIKNLIKTAEKLTPYIKDVCRECMHCLEKFECPQGIHFPTALALYARWSVAGVLGREQLSFKDEYEAMELDASVCIECGECIPWCEYHLEIPEMMKNTHAALSR